MPDTQPFDAAAAGNGEAQPPDYQYGPAVPEVISSPAGPSRRRGPVVAVVGVAAVAALGAAGAIAVASAGKPSAQTAAQVVTAASMQTRKASSMAATFTETIGGLGTVSASVQERLRPLLMSMTMSENVAGRSVPISAIFDSSAMYMRFGQVLGFPGYSPDKWIKIPFTGTGAAGLSSMLGSLQSENPASQAVMLAGAQDVRQTGSQVLDGIQTTSYSGSISEASALKALPAAYRSTLGPELKSLTGTIAFTVWIDRHDLVRKLELTETVAGEPLDVTLNVQSYDQPVTITIPAGSQVIAMPTSLSGGVP
jgi:hypothetical protein